MSLSSVIFPASTRELITRYPRRARAIISLPICARALSSAARFPFSSPSSLNSSCAAALRLGVGDVCWAPVLSLLRLVGADEQASALIRRSHLQHFTERRFV